MRFTFLLSFVIPVAICAAIGESADGKVMAVAEAAGDFTSEVAMTDAVELTDASEAKKKDKNKGEDAESTETEGEGSGESSLPGSSSSQGDEVGSKGEEDSSNAADGADAKEAVCQISCKNKWKFVLSSYHLDVKGCGGPGASEAELHSTLKSAGVITSWKWHVSCSTILVNLFQSY